MRPIADVQYGDFLLCAMDQIVDNIAKLRYMSGGKLTLPLVMRAPVGVTGRGAQHAQNLETYFLSCPGIKIVAPATAYDAMGLLRSAVRDDDPVLIFEHKLLYGSKGVRAESGSMDASTEIPDGDFTVPIGTGGRAPGRAGRDPDRAPADDAPLPAGRRAAGAEGISCEVIDPRSLWPLDLPLILASVRKTGRVVLVEESPRQGGVGAEIAAQIAEAAPDCLLAPITRVAAPNTPAPFAPVLEKLYVPQPGRIAEAARRLVRDF